MSFKLCQLLGMWNVALWNASLLSVIVGAVWGDGGVSQSCQTNANSTDMEEAHGAWRLTRDREPEEFRSVPQRLSQSGGFRRRSSLFSALKCWRNKCSSRKTTGDQRRVPWRSSCNPVPMPVCRPGPAHSSNSCQSESAKSVEEERRSTFQSPAFLLKQDVSASPKELLQLIEEKIHFLLFTEEQQANPLSFAVLSEGLTFHLLQLQRKTKEELSSIHTQLSQITGRRQRVTFELLRLEKKKERIEKELVRRTSLQESAVQLCAFRGLQTCITNLLDQSQQLLFQEKAVSELRNLLTQDLQQYQEATQALTELLSRTQAKEDVHTCPRAPGMQGKNQTEQGNTMESESDSNKQPDSLSEEEPLTPRVIPAQNPKYQLFLNNDLKTNGLSSKDADGPGGGGSQGESNSRLSRWETTRPGVNHYRGSLESLASRDYDTMSDRIGVDSPPRVFNSPYATTASMEYNPMHRMSDFKVQGGLSPATSEMNLLSYTNRSPSPVPLSTSTTLISNRPRFSAYDTLLKRRTDSNHSLPQVAPVHYSMRSNTMGGPNRKDFIEELTKQLDACQKRNQFLEAESVEMEKERNQIRFEMRGLLVNNEDLLRTNAQMNNEMKRMREQMIEIDREKQTLGERVREMEIEVKQARDMMVEANTQEYAFNFLQQSLKNQIQDAEENLEKQTQHTQTLSEKLWLAERRLEELEVDKDTRDKRSSDLNNTVFRLETEARTGIL
ncbi:uncharacterized protein ACB058_004595 [Synchiropus picturatus]